MVCVRFPFRRWTRPFFVRYGDLNFIADDANWETVDLNSGVVAPRAVTRLETPSVPGTTDNSVLDLACGQ